MKPKFRAWLKNDKEMINVDEIHWYLGKFEFIGDGITFQRLADEVELMQSTDLRDRNSVEIFEGDIISDGHTSRDIRHHQTFGFYTIDGNGDEEFFGDTASLEDFEEVSKYMSENIEIIGNIYENKDILEDYK